MKLILLFAAFAIWFGSATQSGVDVTYISLAGTPSTGDAAAAVAIVEFADYQCPYCVAYTNNILPQLLTDYVKTGKVRYFFKDLPIEYLHPDAFKAAEAGRCAGDQGKFAQMHERLFKSTQDLSAGALPRYARLLGLDVSQFQQCLDSRTHAEEIRKDIQDSQKYGVQGTPTFFIGPFDPLNARMKAVTKIEGSQTYGTFQQALEKFFSSDAGRD